MDVTKLLASVPILKTLNNASNEAKAATVSSSAKSTSAPVSDSIDVSAALGADNSLSSADAEALAQDVGSYFANNDDAIGADANKLSQL